MKIAIISDTHGVLRPKVKEILQNVDFTIHAGDIGQERILEEIKKISSLYVVRGNCDGPWADWLLQEAYFIIGGKRFYLTHDLQKMGKLSKAVDVVVGGHTHQFETRWENNTLYINPGSCGPKGVFHEPTMALLSWGEDGLLHVDKRWL